MLLSPLAMLIAFLWKIIPSSRNSFQFKWIDRMKSHLKFTSFNSFQFRKMMILMEKLTKCYRISLFWLKKKNRKDDVKNHFISTFQCSMRFGHSVGWNLIELIWSVYVNLRWMLKTFNSNRQLITVMQLADRPIDLKMFYAECDIEIKRKKI